MAVSFKLCYDTDMFPFDLAHLPAEKGTYLIGFRFDPPPRPIKIGKLGVFTLPAADYLYVGSAHGSGGLRARLRHHLRINPKPHWHLDYLKPWMYPAFIACLASPVHLECVWSQRLQRQPAAIIPIPGFGASDCRARCAAHLIRLTLNPAALPLLLAASELQILTAPFD
ncbi:MAG: GIY-YIG nuclease family protein [Anaerolineaceae bacterium]|nr:GIY-YIG nuclease family protein [Anaerolineaceae bacterium]